MAQFAQILLAGFEARDQARLSAQLQGRGYAVTSAGSASVLDAAHSQHPDIAVLSLPAGGDVSDLSRAIRQDPELSSTPVVVLADQVSPGLWQSSVADGASDVMAANAGDSEIYHRLWPLVRMAAMEKELALRTATAKSFGVDVVLGDAAINGEFRVLLVSDGDGDLVSLLRSSYNLTTIGDPYAAEAILLENKFDAMIVAPAADTMEQALDLCAQVRRNAKLFDLPMLFLASGDDEDARVKAYDNGVSLALPHPGNAADLNPAIPTLVMRQRRKWQIRAALQGTLTEKTGDTGLKLYNEDFFKAHLERLIGVSTDRGNPLSLITLDIRNLPGIKQKHGDDEGDALFSQVASLMSRLVRVEDLAAFYGDNGFHLVLPNTALEDARLSMNRVHSILVYTEFGIADEAVSLWLASGCATFSAGDDPADLIGRAIQDMQ